eukprot:567974-Prymnesium_polylepis.1
MTHQPCSGFGAASGFRGSAVARGTKTRPTQRRPEGSAGAGSHSNRQTSAVRSWHDSTIGSAAHDGALPWYADGAPVWEVAPATCASQDGCAVGRPEPASTVTVARHLLPRRQLPREVVGRGRGETVSGRWRRHVLRRRDAHRAGAEAEAGVAAGTAVGVANRRAAQRGTGGVAGSARRLDRREGLLAGDRARVHPVHLHVAAGCLWWRWQLRRRLLGADVVAVACMVMGCVR